MEKFVNVLSKVYGHQVRSWPLGRFVSKKSILGKKCDTSRNKAKLIASSWFFHFHIRIEISKNEVLQVEFFEFSNEKLKFSNHEVMNIQV